MNRFFFLTALSLVSLESRALDFTGNWRASASDVIYMDQRGRVPCLSDVEVLIQQTASKLDLRVTYDCGPAPGGDRAIPYFMRGWRPLDIVNGDLLLDGHQDIGRIEDSRFAFSAATPEGSYPSVRNEIRFWSEGIHAQWLFFEHESLVNGQVVRYLKARLNRR